MKYNVFARPMFKRGGMSQGTGITSGLDTPRRNFQYAGLAYGQQSFPDKKLSTIEEATKAVAGPTSDYKNALLDYWIGTEDKDLFKREPDATESSLFGIPLKPNEPKFTDPSGLPSQLDKQGKTGIETLENEQPSIESTTEKAPTKSEEDILLDQLGDTSLSKCEKALMLADIIGTAGGLEGKTKKALELAKSKAKQDRLTKRDIAKLKYLQKGKERIAGISAGTLGSTEKTINASVEAQKNAAIQSGNFTTDKKGVKRYNGKTEAELKNDAFKSAVPGDDNTKLAATKILIRDNSIIRDLKNSISKLEDKPEKNKKKLDQKKKELAYYENMAKVAGLESLYASGGRVNYAQGTPMQEPAIAATQTPNANATENTRPVNKLTFSELRNRLPKEITDDVVQLLSKSEEALQDFAYIQTQEDINKFNVKYGVNVILPPQA